MRYMSVCSGIEAATVAWHPLGWMPAAFSEIEPFPRAVLAHHYPGVPLHGDFTTIKGDEYGPIDLLVGGTPCQDFSIAGLRAGLAGERGNLTLKFLRLAARTKPRWIVWENVPGVLSSDGGRALGAFLGGLAELGYGFAYRVLDAQYFGLAQRRARVFVVGHLGDWRRAAAVLLERESLLWNPPPRREARQGVARPIAAGSDSSGGYRNDADTAENLVVGTITGRSGNGSRKAGANNNLIAHALKGEGFDASEDETGRGIPLTVATLDANYGRLHGASGQDANHGHSHLVPLCLSSGQANAEVVRDGEPSLTCLHEAPIVACDTTQITSPTNRSQPATGKPCHGLSARGHPPAIAFDARQSDVLVYGDHTGPIDTGFPGAAIAFSANDHGADAGPISPTLRAGGFANSHANGGVMPAVAFDMRGREGGAQFEGPHDTDNIRAASGGSSRSYVASTAVRRLTPRECERLQGFPDDYTRIPRRLYKQRKITKTRPADLWEKVASGWMLMAADGPRYKALGNSMAVPVMRWIGERIAMVERLSAKVAA